jgi:pimeloyl-ACP methyl ester carboxylesterase
VPRPVEFRNSGVVVRGEATGDGGARGTVLLLHGGGQTRHAWGAGARQLAAQGWECVAIDLRGHGDSDWAPDQNYDIKAYVADVRQVCTEIGGNVVLVGASLGGITALVLAAQAPELVRALVLVDIVPRPEPAGTRRIVDYMTSHLDGFASLDDVADSVAEYTGRPRRANIEGLTKNVRQRSDGRWYWHWDPAMMTPTVREEPRPGISGDALMDCARGVRAPVLVIRGDRSDVVSDDGLRELTDALPDIHVAIVKGAGHMVAGDDNDAFMAAVTEFLDSTFPPHTPAG